MKRKREIPDLAARMSALKSRIESAGMKPSDFPVFAFPAQEVEEMMNFYTPHTRANQKKIKVDYGSAVSILGFRGIAV